MCRAPEKAPSLQNPECPVYSYRPSRKPASKLNIAKEFKLFGSGGTALGLDFKGKEMAFVEKNYIRYAGPNAKALIDRCLDCSAFWVLAIIALTDCEPHEARNSTDAEVIGNGLVDNLFWSFHGANSSTGILVRLERRLAFANEGRLPFSI